MITLLRALPEVIRIEPVGSRVTCNPPPTDTDADYLVLVGSMVDFRTTIICDFGYELDGSQVADASVPLNAADRFSSYSQGDINLIVTSDATFFRKFMAASSVAKRLNLLDKSDRIALFQAVLYGNADGDL